MTFSRFSDQAVGEKIIVFLGAKKYRDEGYIYGFVLSEAKGEILISEAVAQGIAD